MRSQWQSHSGRRSSPSAWMILAKRGRNIMTDSHNFTRRTLLGTTAAAITMPRIVRAQNPAEGLVAELMPISGMYSQFGQDCLHGAQLGVEHINASGGIKSLGGAKL